MSMSIRRSMIEKESTLSVRQQTELLGINRSLVYYVVKPPFNEEDYRIMKRIDELYTLDPCYGLRRQYEQLNREGYKVGRDRVKNYMRHMDLKVIYPKKKTSIPNKEHLIYPYLLKDMEINTPNKVWAGDITYIRLNNGFCYLTALIDWYTRFILSWVLSNSLDRYYCIEALDTALRKYGSPSIFNSDQGSQYTSLEHTGKLKEAGINISMDSVGRWADNVIIERWFRTLKYEHIYVLEHENFQEAYQGIKVYINYYNYQRLHSSLQYHTPSEIYFSEN